MAFFREGKGQVRSKSLKTIESQIRSAAIELKRYPPTVVNWQKRATNIARTVIPILCRDAHEIKLYVEGVLNAPMEIRRLWTIMLPTATASPQILREFDRQLALDDVLRATVTGETISKVFTETLLNRHPGLCCNGSSDYPDIYDSTSDYSQLPLFKRRGTTEFGAARKGKKQHPVRVPDGIEIKTCRNNLRVDCHHPHAGLHVILIYSVSNRCFLVSDIRVGFLTISDYRESQRNTTSTTVKYSFNGERFVSVLH